MVSPVPPHHTDGRSPNNYSYFIFVIAVVAILLLASNMVVIGCCSSCGLVRAVKRFLRSRGLLSGSAKDEESDISQLIPAFKYRKEQAAVENECSVCLMPFLEEEEVRQLPECRHLFHKECIDMWLYSHSNCPMCRTDVLLRTLKDHRAPAATLPTTEDVGQNQGRLLESSGVTGVVISLF